jgi:hypothetical protein
MWDATMARVSFPRRTPHPGTEMDPKRDVRHSAGGLMAVSWASEDARTGDPANEDGPPLRERSTTMGLLVSDTLQLDLALEDSIRWQRSLLDYAYTVEQARDVEEYETPEPAY